MFLSGRPQKKDSCPLHGKSLIISAMTGPGGRDDDLGRPQKKDSCPLHGKSLIISAMTGPGGRDDDLLHAQSANYSLLLVLLKTRIKDPSRKNLLLFNPLFHSDSWPGTDPSLLPARAIRYGKEQAPSLPA